MNAPVVVDHEVCRGCGACILACPRGCLLFGDHFNDLGYHPVVFRDEGCRADGLCADACPVPGALAVSAPVAG